ncbi:FecR domain-containing protein [Pseudomonas rubra]|uniref:FecR domain-containing protein n=1 Tax=Pseudomonas rubra TaxID=2942627 RepID=A0ABT5PG33_9PSED|nr:FecR domain-containing protein [Pseudomonas rubra]MDD1017279.1 FecR domain-containing protein [Pseudomonas rubra]MDD1041803.1 FecR domain-containing protein [Pseudomonas rubra]MDD1157888.1 FecR domain-containing protein [Pseudomonas rubra]
MPALNPRQLAALEQAAAWRARLGDESAGAAEHAAWHAWMQADEQHPWAWQQVEQVQQRLQQMPAGLAGRTLALSAMSRRSALKGLVLVAGAGGLGWAGYQQARPDVWFADYQTRTGERRSLTLEDGSQVQLNTASALDVRFDPQQRLLVLRDGEVLITTAKDPANRPFLVQTRHGTLQALGTRFSVLAGENTSRLAVFENQVLVLPGEQGGGALLEAGEQCRFANPALVLSSPLEGNLDAWSKGLLIANEQYLGAFIAELSRYRRGWLRCAPEVVGLRISGTFRLDDQAQIFRALESTLPVRISQHTPYWVTVQAR